MNKNISIVVIVLILLGIGWYYYGQTTKPAPVSGEAIKIGAILPLTGPAASSGEFSKNSIELAVKDLEKDGQKVEVVYEDTQFDGKVGLTAYNKLKTVDNVDAIFVFTTPAAMAIAPVANTDKIPVLAITATPAFSTPNDYTFRMIGTAEAEAEIIASIFTKKLSKKRLAILYQNSDYGKGGLDGFKKYVTGDAKIVAEENALPGAVDYKTQLTKIKSTNPEAIFLVTLYKEAGIIAKQARELGITSVLACGQPCENPELITASGEAIEGMIVVAPVATDSYGFNERYKETYGIKPSYVGLRSYDAIKILASVGKECAAGGYEGECMKDGLTKIKNFPGLSYKINFDQNGDINDQFVTTVVKNGEYIPYE